MSFFIWVGWVLVWPRVVLFCAKTWRGVQQQHQRSAQQQQHAEHAAHPTRSVSSQAACLDAGRNQRFYSLVVREF
jgi:DNA topoisomerase IA